MRKLKESDISLIIEMAWDDDTPFAGIAADYGLKEQDVMKIMKANLRPKAYENWRKRVQGRIGKHPETRAKDTDFY